MFLCLHKFDRVPRPSGNIIVSRSAVHSKTNNTRDPNTVVGLVYDFILGVILLGFFKSSRLVQIPSANKYGLELQFLRK